MKRRCRQLASVGAVLLFTTAILPAQDGADPPLPAELQKVAADYNANFQANEDRFRQRYEAGLATVRANPHLSAADRQRYARMLYEQYRQRSAANVAFYREPLVQAIGTEAARRGGGQGHLQQTLGSNVLTADGEVSATHRGARGDTDMGGTAGRANEAARIATRLGFTPDAGNPNYLDIKSLELTINYETAGQSASGRGWTDTPGSSAHEAVVRSAARADETYISIAMSDTQPAKNAVLIQDHLKKANHGRALDADALLSDRHQAGLQVYSKGALKAAETAGLGEVELQAVLDRSGLDIGPQEYQRMLDNLKLGYPPDAVGLTPDNAARFKRATDALLDAADARSTELAREQLAAQQERLERLESSLGDPELTPEDRANLRRQIERGRLERADSLVRLREAREANAALRGGAPVEHLPGTPRQLPDIDPGATVTLLTTPPRPSGTGTTALGRVGSGAARVADVLDLVTLAKTAADLAAKGDGAGLAGLLGEIALGVGSERLGVAALTKISPQLATLYETYQTAHGATRTFMELPIPGTDGRTLDAITQDVMLASMDLTTGAAGEDRTRREAAAAVLHVTALRKDGFTVAGGLTGPEIIARINANIAAGRPSLDGISFEYPESAALAVQPQPALIEVAPVLAPAASPVVVGPVLPSQPDAVKDGSLAAEPAPPNPPPLGASEQGPVPVTARAGGATESDAQAGKVQQARQAAALQKEIVSLFADFSPHLSRWEREFNRALDAMEAELNRERAAVEADWQAGRLTQAQFDARVNRYNGRRSEMQNYNALLQPVSWRRAGEAHVMLKQMMQAGWSLRYDVAAMEQSVLAGVPLGEKGTRAQEAMRELDADTHRQTAELVGQIRSGLKSGSQILAELAAIPVKTTAPPDGPERLDRHFVAPPIPDWRALAGAKPPSPPPDAQVVAQDDRGVWTWEWQRWEDVARTTRQALVYRTHGEIEANRRNHGRMEGGPILMVGGLPGTLHGLMLEERNSGGDEFRRVSHGRAEFSADGGRRSLPVGWQVEYNRKAAEPEPQVTVTGYENGRGVQKFEFNGDKVDRAILLVQLDGRDTWWQLTFDESGRVVRATETSRAGGGAGAFLGKEVRFVVRFDGEGGVTRLESKQGDGWGWIKDDPVSYSCGRMVDGRRVGAWTRYALADGRPLRRAIYSLEGKLDLASTKHFTENEVKLMSPGPRPGREDFLDYRPPLTAP